MLQKNYKPNYLVKSIKKIAPNSTIFFTQFKLLQALVKSLDAVLFVHKGTIANQK